MIDIQVKNLTKFFVIGENLLDGLSFEIQEGERILLEGNIPSPVHPPKGCKFHTRCYMACEKCTKEEPPKVEISPGHWAVCHFAQHPRKEK